MSEFRERPILYSTNMVRKILHKRREDAIKTMTRRLSGLKVINQNPDAFEYSADTNTELNYYVRFVDLTIPKEKAFSQAVIWVKCPYGRVGNYLWVRETASYILDTNGDIYEGKVHRYKADDLNQYPRYNFSVFQGEFSGECGNTTWRPSIFMPRWASRILLQIDEIRVERLQDISEEDAEAEGASHITVGNNLSPYMSWDIRPPQGYRAGFRNLWDSINEKKSGCSWKDNPFVWVIKFHRVENADNSGTSS